jgi:hypothetical protein
LDHRKLSATVHDFSGTIMHALLPKAYAASKRSAYLDRWHVGLDREWQEWLSFIDDPRLM